MRNPMPACLALFATVLVLLLSSAVAQEIPRAQLLRGEYGKHRSNNDLLYYHLDIRVDPEKRRISGKNTVRFRMLESDTRIQLDLHADMAVDKVVMGDTALKVERELNTVWIDFPQELEKGRVYEIDFHYSGTPKVRGRFGAFVFGRDPQKRPWIYTSCEGPGAMSWWPCKEQWRDEVDSMRISIAAPSELVSVSNGALMGRHDLGDGYTRSDWLVQYPINNYCVSVNIGKYVHFGEKLDDLSMDYFVLPEDLEKAKKQFQQTRGVLQAFEHWFGEYPFKKDGFKLIQVPYAGMEHQSAVTYGNRFTNGYYGRDWTGVGISMKFDFIIVHEAAHEWFGNAVSAADVSDMWIHEGFGTYLEVLYVEYVFGYDAAVRYVNGYKNKVRNQAPIISKRGVHAAPPADQYFKGALFLHTLRNVVDNDTHWRSLLKDLYNEFCYQNIMTEDIVAFCNEHVGEDLTPIFNQYLRRTALPVLELRFDPVKNRVAYRWQAEEPGFAMPVKVGRPGRWQTIRPTKDWADMPTLLHPKDFEVATELFYIDVRR